MGKELNLKLKVWRQDNADDHGRFEEYDAKGIDTDMSFLEMLDVVNEGLIEDGQEPIAFDSDCREGICGTCSMSSTAQRTVGSREPRHASCTCGISAMA